ncbi:MAG: YIP1 family protein [Bryobacteraceae bacterium]
MTPENAAAVEPQPAGMGELARLTGVFFEPGKTFADVVQRPSWFVPMLLTVLFGLIFCVVVGQRIGWDNIAQQQMEKRMAKMQPEQRAQAMQQADLTKKITQVSAYTIAVIGPAIGYLIAAAVLLGIVAGILSAPVKFKQVFAIMCYSGMIGVVAAGLTVVVIFLKKNPADFDIQHPLAFNAGALMDPNGPNKFLFALASSLDLFSLWRILLIAVGLKAAAGKKLSFGGALFAVLLPWCVLVLIGATFAGMFG